MMTFLKNALLFLILLSTLTLGTLFAVQNTAMVPLDLLVFSFAEHSVALWVLLAFALGGLVGMFTNIGLVLRLRSSLRRADKLLAAKGKGLN